MINPVFVPMHCSHYQFSVVCRVDTRSSLWRLALVLLFASAPIWIAAVAIAAEPVYRYAHATAVQLHDTKSYVAAVLGEEEP